MATIQLVQPSDSVFSVELSRPIHVNGSEVKTMYFRDLNIGILERIERGASAGGSVTSGHIAMVSALTGVPENDVRRISLGDLKNIEKACEDFFTESGAWQTVADALALAAMASSLGSGAIAQHGTR